MPKADFEWILDFWYLWLLLLLRFVNISGELIIYPDFFLYSKLDWICASFFSSSGDSSLMLNKFIFSNKSQLSLCYLVALFYSNFNCYELCISIEDYILFFYSFLYLYDSASFSLIFLFIALCYGFIWLFSIFWST